MQEKHEFAHTLFIVKFLSVHTLDQQDIAQSLSSLAGCLQFYTYEKQGGDFEHKKCTFWYYLSQDWLQLFDVLPTLVLEADLSNNELQNRLTLLIQVDSVSSDGDGPLMDRMFSVYICIPGWLYLLLTAPNELTHHTAALLSLSWIKKI